MRRTLPEAGGKSPPGPSHVPFEESCLLLGGRKTRITLLFEGLDFFVDVGPVIGLGDFPQIDVLRDVAAFRIDGNRTARADPRETLDRIDSLLRILLAAGRLDHLVDHIHAVIGADGREGELGLIADRLGRRINESLVFRRVMRDGIVEGRLDAECGITERRQVGFLGQVARRKELDAGSLQAVFIVSLDETERRRPRRQEGENALCAGILDALHDRAEVVGCKRHADRLDHLAAGLFRNRP